jgi:hypothetical protein
MSRSCCLSLTGGLMSAAMVIYRSIKSGIY